MNFLKTRSWTMLPCSIFFFFSAIAQKPTHPLDPLNADEMQQVVQILKSTGTTTGHDYFNIINLKEPPKKEVLSWRPNTPFRREAFASFYDYAKPGMTEAIIDLNAGKIVKITNIPNVIGMGLE